MRSPLARAPCWRPSRATCRAGRRPSGGAPGGAGWRSPPAAPTTSQPRADHQREREDGDVEQPQRPAERLDLAGDGRRRPTVRSGHEQPAGDRDARAERREHRRPARSTATARSRPAVPAAAMSLAPTAAGTGPTRSSATRVKASADTLSVSLRRCPDRHRTGALSCLASNSASARRNAAASSAPTRSTKCTSAASRLPESDGLVERVDHQAGDQFVAAVRGRVPVRTIVAMLNDEVLLRQPLKHRHDRRVGEVAFAPTAPRAPGARSGVRATTTGGPSPRVPVPLDASTWPCSVHLHEHLSHSGYYGLTTVRRIRIRSTRRSRVRARGVRRRSSALSARRCESSHKGLARSVATDYSKANLTYWRCP